jgi:hypothetical protein
LAARSGVRAAWIKENQTNRFAVGAESPIRVGYPSGADRIMKSVAPLGTTPAGAGASEVRIKEVPAMSIRRAVEGRISGSPPLGGSRIGGGNYPAFGTSDIERRLKATEKAVQALRAGLLTLADEVERLSRDAEKARRAA